jgi:hypothetical protein
MSVDIATMKRRSALMMALSLGAGLAAAAALVGYIKLHQSWALVAFLAAVIVGFGAQIWFIAGLRGPSKGA